MADNLVRHMFPGNNSSQGFFSYFAYILPPTEARRIYCLKGSPGVGRSTFLKRIGERMALEGFHLEYIHCTSDPNSLDCLMIPALGVALIDGTAPHVADSVYPAAVDEIINLGEYWNAEAIRQNHDEIIRINTDIKRQYKHAYQYFAATKYLMDDILETLESTTEKASPLLQARRIIDNELEKVAATGRLGKTRRLFASAITPSGAVNYLESLANSADKVYSIRSLWGVGVNEMLKKMTDEVIFRRLDVELYYSPLTPETCIGHILIPEPKLAFLSEKDGFELRDRRQTILDLTQYIDPVLTKPQKDATGFNFKTFDTLLGEALKALAQTKKLYDELEGHYIPHMDFERVQQKEEEICEQILALAK